MRFLDRSRSAFHAVELIAEQLKKAGYQELNEQAAWRLVKGAGYFVRRQDSSIIVFKTAVSPVEDGGFRIAGAHTDSPGFRIKTDSENAKAGTVRVSVEAYGGPIRSSWFDRELGMAGRVLINRDTGLETELFCTESPCALIPNAAIHLNREINKGVEHNIQNDMKAILTVTVAEAEVRGYVRRLVAQKKGVPMDSVYDYDLFLFPAETAQFVGDKGDMFMSGRIDNLAMAHAIITAIVEAEKNSSTLVGALFDSEEIGSQTWQGARSSFLRDILHRIAICGGGGEEEFLRALAGSFMISGDAAHAAHPNYIEKYDADFAPELNMGPVVKIHAGQAYTTNAETGGRFLALCRRKNIPAQRFYNRSDMSSGSTIGPLSSSRLGVPSVDIGSAIWAMHSARETAGVKDQDYMKAALVAFFEEDGL